MRTTRYHHILWGILNAMRNHFLVALLSIFSSTFSYAQTADSTRYTTIHYKGKALIGANDEYRSCQFNLVNAVDSFLFIQINVAGLDIGRAMATPNNILLINKIERKYYEGDYSFFQKLLGFEIDFFTIQAIFNSFPFSIPEGVHLSYQGEMGADEYPFFKTLTGEYERYSLELEVKKVTFNDIPEVSATIPKNATPILFCDED